jgi:DnaJ-class molecular chaperone
MTCSNCGGTGKNRHTEFSCDSCSGTGRVDWMDVATPYVILALSACVSMLAAKGLWHLIHK